MKKIPDKEKSVKKSVSFPVELWKWVEEAAGPYGVPSRVIQQAVKALKESGRTDFKKAAQIKKRNRET